MRQAMDAEKEMRAEGKVFDSFVDQQPNHATFHFTTAEAAVRFKEILLARLGRAFGVK